jgi:hypothetical protein
VFGFPAFLRSASPGGKLNIAIPPPPDPPFDIEKRRGSGGVLNAGEAGARRESPPNGAGESNLRAHRTAVAGHPGMDSRRRCVAGIQLFRLTPRIRKAVGIPTKTVPSSSSIPTEATESTAPEKSAARKKVGKAERTPMLATVAATHESRHNRVSPSKIRLPKQHWNLASSFAEPSLPPDPLTSRRQSAV